MSELLELAQRAVRMAKELGADQVVAGASEGSQISLTRRDGKVEEATEATTRRMGISLLVDDRYSSHSTSDLRDEALRPFIRRAIDATRFLEPDPDRALPPAEECGRGVAEATLDALDPAHASFSPEERMAWAERLEAANNTLRQPDVISSTAYVADGSSRSARVTSDGFAEETHGAWYTLGGEMTLKAGDGKRPEGYAYYAGRYRSDLPSVEQIAAEMDERTRAQLDAGPVKSGKYPLILINRAAPRFLGLLSGPLSGGSLHEGRSCLADRLGTAIGSSALTLIDQPDIPRGLGSRAWDGDGRRAATRDIIRDGVLQSYYINTYFGRKLNTPATVAGRSNWVIPPGEQSWQDIARAFPKAILVHSFLGGNANGTTGDFSYGIRGHLVENGEITQPLAEMNVAGNTTEIFHQLAAIANDPWEWSAVRSPTLVFEGISFSGL